MLQEISQIAEFFIHLQTLMCPMSLDIKHSIFLLKMSNLMMLTCPIQSCGLNMHLHLQTLVRVAVSTYLEYLIHPGPKVFSKV